MRLTRHRKTPLGPVTLRVMAALQSGPKTNAELAAAASTTANHAERSGRMLERRGLAVKLGGYGAPWRLTPAPNHGMASEMNAAQAINDNDDGAPILPALVMITLDEAAARATTPLRAEAYLPFTDCQGEWVPVFEGGECVGYTLADTTEAS